MSNYSFRLSRRPPAETWSATAKFHWGTQTFDTGEKSKAAAAKRAKYLCRQRNAHVRASERTKLQRAGRPIPADLAAQYPPGSRRALAAAAAPPAPAAAPKAKRGRPPKIKPIDPVATAERLRRAAAGAGVSAPAPEAERFDDESPAAGDLGSEEPTPTAIPPMPEKTPEKPEVVDPGGAAGAGADDQADELIADALAMAYTVGVVKMTTSACAAAKPPRRPNEPSATAIRWTQEGLSTKLQQLMGNATLGPMTKFLVGTAGIVLSMVWGSELVTPPTASDRPAASASAGAASATESGEGRPAPAPPESPAETKDLAVGPRNGVPATGKTDYQTPAHGRFYK